MILREDSFLDVVASIAYRLASRALNSPYAGRANPLIIGVLVREALLGPAGRVELGPRPDGPCVAPRRIIATLVDEPEVALCLVTCLLYTSPSPRDIR